MISAYTVVAYLKSDEMGYLLVLSQSKTDILVQEHENYYLAKYGWIVFGEIEGELG